MGTAHPERPDTLLRNPRSERVRKVAALSGRSARIKHGQFLVEGPQAVRELLSHRRDAIRDIYLSHDAAKRHSDIAALAWQIDADSDARLHEATADVVAAMSKDAQGVLAVARRAGLDHTLDQILSAAPKLVAVLVRNSDPGNAGTILRSADAAGADCLVLGGGSVEVTNPKVVRASAGSLFHVPVIAADDVAAAVTALRGAGMQVLAADGAGEWDLDELADRAFAASHDLHFHVGGELAATAHLAPDLRLPTVWLFGNEAHGLDETTRDLAAAAVKIGIHGEAESLNVATAAALCLFASARAQRRAV